MSSGEDLILSAGYGKSAQKIELQLELIPTILGNRGKASELSCQLLDTGMITDSAPTSE